MYWPWCIKDIHAFCLYYFPPSNHHPLTFDTEYESEHVTEMTSWALQCHNHKHAPMELIVRFLNFFVCAFALPLLPLLLGPSFFFIVISSSSSSSFRFSFFFFCLLFPPDLFSFLMFFFFRLRLDLVLEVHTASSGSLA